MHCRPAVHFVVLRSAVHSGVLQDASVHFAVLRSAVHGAHLATLPRRGQHGGAVGHRSRRRKRRLARPAGPSPALNGRPTMPRSIRKSDQEIIWEQDRCLRSCSYAVPVPERVECRGEGRGLRPVRRRVRLLTRTRRRTRWKTVKMTSRRSMLKTTTMTRRRGGGKRQRRGRGRERRQRKTTTTKVTC